MVQIALIDDEPLVRESFARLLSSRDHVTTCYESAEAFLRVDVKDSYHCLIIDFRLPGLNGCELIKSLRAQGVSTPAILLSGNVDETVAAQLNGVRRVRTLDKPCLSEDLFWAVDECTKTDADD